MRPGNYHVLVCARSVEKGEAAVKSLQSKGYTGTCELVQLDQTNDNSINAAVKHIEFTYGRLDVLINNAGIALEEFTRKNMTDNLNTNASSVYVLTQALRPLLQKSAGTARVVTVSTEVGSVSLKLDHSDWGSSFAILPYRVSKAALNMVVAQLIYDFKDDVNVKFFLVCPGNTASSLSGWSTVELGAKPTDEAVKPLTKVIYGERDAEVGKLLHAAGQYPW
jgi:NAD(P)-dependent dehydrogenase (short-subunit alcohol dehydrogenase family)